jgi:hypothetical protein
MNEGGLRAAGRLRGLLLGQFQQISIHRNPDIGAEEWENLGGIRLDMQPFDMRAEPLCQPARRLHGALAGNAAADRGKNRTDRHRLHSKDRFLAILT